MNIWDNGFRPLPECLTISESEIEGLGLFSTQYVPKDIYLGVSHIQTQEKGFHRNLIRTAIGSHINHSDEANCKLIEHGNLFFLKTIAEISPEEELTLFYGDTQCGKRSKCENNS